MRWIFKTTLITCPADGVTLEANTIGNTKGSFQKAAVHYTKNALPVQLTNNKLSNLPNG